MKNAPQTAFEVSPNPPESGERLSLYLLSTLSSPSRTANASEIHNGVDTAVMDEAEEEARWESEAAMTIDQLFDEGRVRPDNGLGTIDERDLPHLNNTDSLGSAQRNDNATVDAGEAKRRRIAITCLIPSNGSTVFTSGRHMVRCRVSLQRGWWCWWLSLYMKLGLETRRDETRRSVPCFCTRQRQKNQRAFQRKCTKVQISLP